MKRRFAVRFLSLLLCVCIVFSSLYVPKARAVMVIDDAAIAIASYLNACGVTFQINGGGAAFDSGLAGLIEEYVGGLGTTVGDWLVDQGWRVTPDGKLLIPKSLASKFESFANWMLTSKGIYAGGQSVTINCFDREWTFHQGSSSSGVSTEFPPDISIDFPSVHIFRRDSRVNWLTYRSPVSCSEPTQLVISLVDAADASPCLFDAHLLDSNGIRYPEGSLYHGDVLIASGQAGISMSTTNPEWRYGTVVFDLPAGFSGFLQMGINRLSGLSIGTHSIRGYTDFRTSTDKDPALIITPAASISVPKSDDMDDSKGMVLDSGVTAGNVTDWLDQTKDKILDGSISTGFDIVDADTGTGEGSGTGEATWLGTVVGWLTDIRDAIISIPGAVATAISNALQAIFVPDAALVAEIAGTFNGKFGFLGDLYGIVADLFNLSPDAEPPCIYIHLQNAEGNVVYGGTEKALDMSWFTRYKPITDAIISGFLWLFFVWRLFKRAPDIISGAGMITDYSTAIDRGSKYDRGSKHD